MYLILMFVKEDQMNNYQEIRLLPNTKLNLGFLWQKVFQQIHIALVENKVAENESEVGLSIPDYVVPQDGIKGLPLGDKIRLFAKTEQQLEQLNIVKWLARLEDYAQVKTIKPVPADCQHACFSRRAVKGERRLVEKARQMAEAKAKITDEPMESWFKQYRLQSAKLSSTLPFIQISRSPSEQSEGKRGFKLFIEMQLHNAPKSGTFNCYGLSHKGENKQATVPWF